MEITIEEAYAEACRALGEQIIERRLVARAAGTPSAVLERDGYRVYPTPDGAFCVSHGGQWLSGCYGSTPEEALEAGRKEVSGS